MDEATVDRLASIAQQLAGRVREDDPVANARWLAAVCPDPADRFRLCFVLAAAVPVNVPWSRLVAWTDEDHRAEAVRRMERRRAQWREYARRKRKAA